MTERKNGILALALIALCVCLCGCGVNRKSPEGVVKSLLSAYEKGKEKQALECYGMKGEENIDAYTQEDIKASIAYFKAHGAKEIDLQDCDEIQQIGDYSYIYVFYEFAIEKGKSYPAISTYLVGKEEKKYYILPAKDIDEALAGQVQTAYQEFMESEVYQNYIKEYEAFLTKYPGYEAQIAAEIAQITGETQSLEEEAEGEEAS